MSKADSMDLNSIAQEMTGLLEARISDLLGHVKASRDVTQRLLDADAELTKLSGVQQRLAAVLDPLGGDDGPETAELRRRLESVTSRVDKLATQRTELIDRLKTLKSKLHG